MALTPTLDNRTATTFTISVPFDGSIDSYNLYVTGRGQPAAKNRKTLVRVDSFNSADTGGGRTAFTGSDDDYHLSDRDQFYVLLTAVTGGSESSINSSVPILVPPATEASFGSPTSAFQHTQLVGLDPARRVLVPITGEYDPATGEYKLHTASEVEIEVSDIQIGAVELKNRDTDDRVIITPDGGLSILPVQRTNRFYASITPSGFGGGADAVFGFVSRGFQLTLLNPTLDAIVSYSFDGSVVHGTLRRDGIREKVFDFRTEQQVWFRVDAGSSDVEVEAW